MPRPKNNSHKEFDNEKKFLWLKNSPPPTITFLNEPMNLSWTRIHHRHPKLTLRVRVRKLNLDNAESVSRNKRPLRLRMRNKIEVCEG